MSEPVIFLSRLRLDAGDRQVQRDLRDPYQMHKTLARAWGEGDEYQTSRVLFRVEEAQEKAQGKAQGEAACVLVQSLTAPDWAMAPGKYLQVPAQLKEWTPSLRAGQALRFCLLANPTVKRDGKRLGLYGEIEQLQWLARKGEQSGVTFSMTRMRHREGLVSVPDVVATMQGQHETEKREGATEARFTRLRCAVGQHLPGGQPNEQQRAAAFCAVRFEGALRVADPELLAQAVRGGVGSGKALGFGLLSLARA